MAKIASILQAQTGWDSDSSQPANRAAVAHYLDWLATVSPKRLNDAEPMLTDDGFVRMEWSRGDTDFTAEIGPDSLWFCVLGSDPSTDDSIELEHFDRFRLETFFNLGKLR